MSNQKQCTKCQEEFLVIDQEVAFLNERGLPEPEKCPLCRQEKRISLRNEQKLYGSSCDNCGNQIIIAFKHPADQKVFCKNCYLSYFENNDALIKD